MDAFTDIGWFLYISLDSYKVWMHLQTLVGFCTYLFILIKYRCIYRDFISGVNSRCLFVYFKGFDHVLFIIIYKFPVPNKPLLNIMHL